MPIEGIEEGNRGMPFPRPQADDGAWPLGDGCELPYRGLGWSPSRK